MDLVSGNDANKFKIYFLADLPLRGLATEDTISRSKILGVMSHLTIVKDAFLDLVTFLLGGGFGATKSLFLDILLAGGISSTSIILFLVDLHVNIVSEITAGGASIEATKVVFRTGSPGFSAAGVEDTKVELRTGLSSITVLSGPGNVESDCPVDTVVSCDSVTSTILELGDGR